MTKSTPQRVVRRGRVFLEIQLWAALLLLISDTPYQCASCVSPENYGRTSPTIKAITMRCNPTAMLRLRVFTPVCITEK
jgi:hypothetical protein